MIRSLDKHGQPLLIDAGRIVPQGRRLFIGVFPGGLSYADRWTEQHGDYKRLAFLPYSTLALQVEPDCPPDLRQEIESHAATIIARRGQPFQVSACGQTVTLGQELPDLP